MVQNTITLLVVDDEEADRLQIRRLVKRSGLRCDCVEAETLEKALGMFDRHKIDCVILDNFLPGEQGLGGISTMLGRNPFLPVIMSTGQGNEKIAKEAIQLGAMDYLCKNDLTVSGLRAVIENVLDRARLNRKVSEQQAALAVFAKVLVHDLKAPTQSILGFARLVETFLQQGDFDPEKIVQQARRIAEGALRMDAVLSKLHAYNEADAQPQFENVPLDKIISDVLANLDATLQKTGARVIQDDLPIVCADRAQLILLMQNLIGNGIKYCQASAPEVQVLGRPLQNGFCEIEVRDNGIGIAESHYRTIFEPFRRLHSQGEFDGSGLGLATCKKVVDQHGGEIWCRSKTGAGTSFFFTMPAVDRETIAAIPGELAAEKNDADAGGNTISA